MRKKKHFSFLNLLIILLSIILAVSVLITIFVMRESGTTFYDSESSLYYSMENEEYSSLVRRYYDNAVGKEADSRVRKLSDYYAVGRYFENAFYANAYKKAQNPEMENRYRRRMEEVEPEMGQFSAEKPRILEIFPDLRER